LHLDRGAPELVQLTSQRLDKYYKSGVQQKFIEEYFGLPTKPNDIEDEVKKGEKTTQELADDVKVKPKLTFKKTNEHRQRLDNGRPLPSPLHQGTGNVTPGTEETLNMQILLTEMLKGD